MAILDGFIKAKRYRFLDSGNYQLESAWTSSQTTYMDDGSTLQDALQSLRQDITEIKVVTSLPSDAASHPTTLYLVVDN